MTKKILAMFLAVLMVVSILPASVLATENDCPLAGQAHNLDNCTDYSVKKVVAATCENGGYTLYECDLCDATFMGNHTAKLAHEKSSVVEAAKAPTFTEAGNVTKYHCDVCDNDWFESEPSVIAPLDKNVANTLFDCEEDGKCAFEWENEDKACATGGMIATCVKCGRQIVSKAPHTINYNATEIIEAPTATANGKAEAPCTVCGEKATLIIYPNHDHRVQANNADDTYTLVEIPEAPDCVTGGTIAHLKCIICDKLFLEEEGVLVEKTLADLKGEPVDEEDPQHTIGTLKGVSEFDDEVVAEAVTCTTNGVLIYDCSVCLKEIVEVIPAGHDWDETEVIAMTCGQDGITIRECDRCGFTDTVTEEAPEHTTLEEYLAAFEAIGNAIVLEDLELEYDDDCYVIIGGENTGFLKPVTNTATCTAKGQYSWNCLNCGALRTAESAKLNHNIASFTVPATCATVSYTFEYCTNAGCPTYAGSSVVEDEDGEEYKAYVETQVEVIEAVMDEDETEIIGYEKVMVDYVIEAPAVKGEITEFGTTKDSNSHRFGLETKVEPTCTTAGNYYKKCADCGFEVKSTPAATGHTAITNPNHATKAPLVVPSVCGEDGEGSITYYCKNCNEVAKVEELAPVTDLQYNDYDEAYAAHNGSLVFASEQIGTCTQFGYVKYNCSNCDHAVIVSDRETGMGHKDSMTFDAEEAGTISVPESINGGYIVIVNAVKADGTAATGRLPVAITIHGVTIENFGEEVQILNDDAFDIALSELFFVLEDDDHPENNYEYTSYTFTVNFYTKQYPTCTVDGAIIAHNCINEWCDIDLTAANAQLYQFTEKKLNKLGHDYVTVKEAVTGVCGELQTRALITCSRCGDIQDKKVNGQTVADYYDGRVEVTVIPGWNIDEAICKNETPLYDIYFCEECETYHIRNYKPVVPHTWNNGVVTTPASCSSTGVKTFTCTVPGCGATRTEIIPAKQHKNSDGEFFTANCNDTEDNRHCVVCCAHGTTHDCTTQKSNGEYTCACMIGKAHSDTLEAIEDRDELSDYWHAPTCTAAGYYLVICEFCGEADVDVPEFVDGSATTENVPAGHIAPNYTLPVDEAAKILYQQKYTNVGGKAYLNYVAPTVLADGSEKFECATCGGVIERTLDRLENLQFSLNASNADAPACDKFAELSLLALTVKASGVDATLAGFNMTIEVDGEALFVGYEWAENTPFLGAVTEPINGQGSINIVGRVIGSNEIAVEDEVLVTLYFRVFDDVEFSFENDAVYAVNAVEEIESSVQGVEVEVIALGDVNDDGAVFGNAILDDLQAAINIFMGVEGAESYNVAADINRNGEIDLQDLQLMCKISAGNMDEIDIWFLNAYEGEVDLVVELTGLCLECHLPFNTHATTCSKYVRP